MTKKLKLQEDGNIKTEIKSQSAFVNDVETAASATAASADVKGEANGNVKAKDSNDVE